ncbi:ATP synthase F1 subunit epsilon [Limibaculum sp. FT325]|uniref:ATP synthase F1 subunit epsilon n=1 Tax=Thermohalobaculum sediminis TaxID=2939436 RepID=UPI0020C11419|nr:ATP synthase F1 subunit epsilon [Limibaculum sediminis]MCL5777007.1 ATP synthase F1 subunit epsilon [Limibaculum sediminis]
MAEMMKFELVSPERKLASAEAESVTVPGMAGDMTAMPNHAPFLTTLRPGFVTVRGSAGEESYFVTGGFAEISPDAVSVLAEEAVEAERVTRSWLDEKIEAFAAAAAEAPAERAQLEALRLNDIRSIAERLGA